jgi:AraC-like DNA-binding protein
MLYHEFQLNAPLTDYIQSIWALESEHADDVYPKSLIMPDGIVELIFHFETPFMTWQDQDSFLQPESFAISMMRKYVEIASTGKSGFVSVRFFPWGAYHFFEKPIQNFLDQTIDASLLWENGSGNIVKELKNTSGMEQRFKVVEQFLLDKLHLHKKQDLPIGDAIRLIRQTKGMLSIEEVCKETGIPKKQLERKFVSSIGTTPKIFSRITRFLNICQNLKESEHKTLIDLTHECGFYDQAHFIKEFKAFSGFTPSDFFQKERVYFSSI